VVLAIAGIAIAIGIPALQNMVVRSRTEGFVREVSSLVQRSRLEAIRRNRPAIVYLDEAQDTLKAFIDVDRDGDFKPDTSKPPGAADFQLDQVDKPQYISFEDEAGKTGLDSIDGLSTVVGGNTGVVIQPDGSVDEEGAFRVTDIRGNHLEVRISPAATGRVEIRMWVDDAATPWDEGTTTTKTAKWFPAGDPNDPNRVQWEWK